MEALACFKRSDKIYNTSKNIEVKYKISSNYYQAKIYNHFQDFSNAQLHAKIYLEEMKINAEKLGNEKSKIETILA